MTEALSTGVSGGGWRRGLSVRLLVLVVCVELLAETLIFLPGLQRERQRWLAERLRDAEVVTLAADAGPVGGLPPAVLERSAALAHLERVFVVAEGIARPVLLPTRPISPSVLINTDEESWSVGVVSAVGSLLPRPARQLRVVGSGTFGARFDLVVPEAPLAAFLRSYVVRFASIGLSIALVTGGLLFLALRSMLVLPLERMARNIAAFRTDPERGVPLDAERLNVVNDDEITMVGRELSAMQVELRTALWRNARLAAVGTAMAKMSHDLRGILSSSLLVADRLTMSTDAKVRDAGEVIVRSVHRATKLAQTTLDFVREGPPAVVRARAALRPLVEEAGGVLAGPGGRGCMLSNEIGAEVEANLDASSMLRVLGNLFDNAAQAGARLVTVSGSQDDGAWVLSIADDGPGLPEAVRAQLFRPFVSDRAGGTGLGLAIARDLARAQGGDLRLEETGPQGTRFSLYLQQPRIVAEQSAG